MNHRPALFTGPTAKLRGTVLSLAALAALLALVVLPSASNVSWAAVYAKSAAKASGSMVSATFTKDGKKPLKGQKVVVSFKRPGGEFMKRMTVTLDKNGWFETRAPKKAGWVTLQAQKSGVKVKKTFKVRKGKDLAVTALLPSKSSGLLPGIFPY